MFYHRESELRDISSMLAKSGKAMMIYGKRRVGKTALALEATEAYGDGSQTGTFATFKVDGSGTTMKMTGVGTNGHYQTYGTAEEKGWHAA